MKKAKKKKPTTMDELTKNYKEFEKRNETKSITKSDVDKLIKKATK